MGVPGLSGRMSVTEGREVVAMVVGPKRIFFRFGALMLLLVASFRALLAKFFRGLTGSKQSSQQVLQ